MLGVDAAMNGAAVLLHPGVARVRAAWVWTKRSRATCAAWELVSAVASETGYRVHGRRQLAPFGAVGDSIREDVRTLLGGQAYALAGEDAVIGRGIGTSIVVARNAGRLLGPLEALAAGQETEWVTATAWRSTILKLPPRTPRDEAKAMSRKWIPARVAGLAEVASLLGGSDDLTDAAGVAAWLAAKLAQPSLPSQTERRKRGASRR